MQWQRKSKCQSLGPDRSADRARAGSNVKLMFKDQMD